MQDGPYVGHRCEPAPKRRGRRLGIAGTLMMIEGSIVTIVLLGWLFLKAARESEERQQLVELASARGIELSERRVARAVAAGRGDELRRRLDDGAPLPG